MDISEERKKIDGIDEKLSELFLERMKVSEQIARYKYENNIPIYDGKREREMIENECSKITETDNKNYYRRFLSSVLDISKDRQRDVFASMSGDELFCGTQGSYSICIGNGCFKKHLCSFNLKRNVMVLTDSGVPKGCAEGVKNAVVDAGGIPYVFSFETGERNKTFFTAEKIIDTMLKTGFTRNDCLVSVGGGVVCDIGGFVASVYMRGIDFYSVPTTLLAMADASVGGKTGVDFCGVKNIIGTFSNPRGVIADLDFLGTLPKRQLSNGMAELIKIGAVLDAGLFEKLVCMPDSGILKEAINDKLKIVCEDFGELSLRKVLNFGHTIGHGIESASDLLHGESVTLGMIAISDGTVREKIINKAELFGLPTEARFDIERALSAITHDKKGNGNGICCVVCPRIGSFEFVEMNITEIERRLKIVHIN